MPEGAATMENTLHKMAKAQVHRSNGGKVETFIHRDIGLCMSNRHDSIFGSCKNREIQQAVISVIIDGIVLNVPDLKGILGQGGYDSPRCSSVITKAYQKWGLDFMSHLQGEFSCAIWDEQEKRLVLARDPFGKKPLHYYQKAAALYFSSEIKGLLVAGVPSEINLVGLSDYLSLNCIPYPATIFKGIYQVPPGGMLIADSKGLRIKTWWEPIIIEDRAISLKDAVSDISVVLERAVSKRLIQEDTYCFLSGGIDSSAIVSFASEIAGKKIHAVSVGFEEEEENELDDAAIMASHVGAEHHPLIVRPDSFFDMLETLVWHHDSPFTDTSAYPTYFAARAGARFTDVILTGDGPDQTMGGSSHYVFAVQNNIFDPRSQGRKTSCRLTSKFFEILVKDPVPSLFSKALRKLYRESLTPVHAAFDLRSYFPDIVKRFLCSHEMWKVHVDNDPFRHPESWFRAAGNVDDVNKYLYADMKFYLPDDLMIKVDRMCMAHGLETLSPFLDRDVVALVNQLPGLFKIRVQHSAIITKYILKEACKDRFPPQILHKKKQGFGIPLENWLRKDNGKMVKDILLDPVTLNRPYFRKEAMENLVDVFLKGKGDYFYPSPNAVAGLLTFEIWHRKYLDEKGSR